MVKADDSNERRNGLDVDRMQQKRVNVKTAWKSLENMITQGDKIEWAEVGIDHDLFTCPKRFFATKKTKNFLHGSHTIKIDITKVWGWSKFWKWRF